MKRTIGQLMTRSPACIQKTATIAEAYRQMRSLKVRHLPVLDGERLAGLVSQADLYRLETIDLVDRSHDLVADTMTRVPYLVSPETPVDEVAERMADGRGARRRKRGSGRHLHQHRCPAGAGGLGRGSPAACLLEE